MMRETSLDLVTYSFESGQRVLARYSEAERKQKGQFFTPAVVARFMAQQLGVIRAGDRILDPAIGSGVLACAIIERAIVEGQPLEFWIDGYEIDPQLAQIAREALERAAKVAATYQVIVHTQVHEENFILNNRPVSQPYLLLAEGSHRPDAYAPYTHIIANPPYYKLNSNDPHVKAIAGQIKGHTNIYSLFLALAAKKLLPGGQACFILPRSFCSGAYFSALRQELIAETLPIAVHVFESRQDTFEADAILQENIIFTFQRRKARSAKIPPAAYVSISASKDASNLHNSKLLPRSVSFHQFLDNRYGDYFFRLPTGELDEQLIEMVNQWSGSLNQYGLNVSTGPVVAFRAQTWLVDIEEVAHHQAVPLLWLQNVKQHRVEWPVSNGNKPQAISLAEEAHSLLVPTRNYVLLRRFSAKEEPRRLIAAPFLADQYNYQWLGLENHLNYVYKKQGVLTQEETLGLSALFNSALIDRYFRIVNGNTQVNATELRALPLPPLELIRDIGRKISETNKNLVDPELTVFHALRFSGHLSPDFPLIKETRITMGKIQEAQEILKTLGLPLPQQNEISALTLLVLAQLSEETPWSAAQGANLRIHDILTEIKKYYAREYAENTRETIRRQVIHQFIQAGLVVRNPDDLSLPTNSPRTHYALSEALLQTIKTYQSAEWPQTVQSFLGSQKTLLEIYQRNREQYKVPLRLATGEEYHLSPGHHNQLQAAIIEEFGPRFAPGARVLYLGDAENKMLILDATGFEELGIPVPSHDKLPDIVLYDQDRNWLFLIEAVTSHGPVSPKRYVELEEVFKGCSAGRIYISAFPNFATFRSFVTDIAWETEVWLAEIPDHLIHFNGESMFRPHIS